MYRVRTLLRAFGLAACLGACEPWPVELDTAADQFLRDRTSEKEDIARCTAAAERYIFEAWPALRQLPVHAHHDNPGSQGEREIVLRFAGAPKGWPYLQCNFDGPFLVSVYEVAPIYAD